MLFRLKHTFHCWQYPERYRLLDDLLLNQTLSKTQLIEKQSHSLTSIVQFAFNNTPFYHKKYKQTFSDFNIDPSPNNLPFLSKAEVAQHKDEMLVRGINKSTLSIGNTGGSTGKPVSFYYDQHKHELMRAGMMRSYMWSGWKPGQKIINFWGARQDIAHSNLFLKRYFDFTSAEVTIPAYEYTKVQLKELSLRKLPVDINAVA